MKCGKKERFIFLPMRSSADGLAEQGRGSIINRRAFIGFFLIGGLIGLFRKALPFPSKTPPYKEAKFWRKTA